MKTVMMIMLGLLVGWNTLADTNTVYFLLVAQSDSFALPLSRAEDIAYARQLMAEPDNQTLHRMIAARIAAGRDGINRNYMKAGAPEWSWHVAEFSGFGDGTVNDWSPSQIDSNPSYYAQLYGGIIGFITYKVTAELGSVLTLTMRTNGGNIQFTWNVDAFYLYTLEGTDSLEVPQWKPVAGARWPYPTNSFTMPLSNAPPRYYYRVKAQTMPPFWGPP